MQYNSSMTHNLSDTVLIITAITVFKMTASFVFGPLTCATEVHCGSWFVGRLSCA